MGSRKENSFKPSIAIAPGETIRENMRALGMDQEELAERLGVTTKHLSHLVNGKVSLTHDMAIKLEDVIGATAKFWMNLEANYQLDRLRIECDDVTVEELELLPAIPYREMMKNGWIETMHARGDEARRSLVNSLRHFFAVASLTNIQEAYDISFRKQKLSGTVSNFSTLAWIRRAEIEGQQRAVAKFDKKLLLNTLPDMRNQTAKAPSVFFPALVEACASCGVALVLVEQLSKTGICGATLWRGEKAILALSLRGKRDDIFWFTFFHEVAHLIAHTKKARLQFDDKTAAEEREADAIASDILISEETYQVFVNEYAYSKRTNIIAYSQSIGVAPSILLGRLQHDKLVGYDRFNDLKKSLAMSN
jgi:HTH-type transcriptional regulator/antitoxin HigA